MASEALADDRRALEDELRGRTAGTLRVLEAASSVDADASGNAAIFVELTLPDPPAGAETWPVDDVLALYRLVNELAAETGVDHPYYVRLRAEHELEVDDDDDEFHADAS